MKSLLVNVSMFLLWFLLCFKQEIYSIEFFIAIVGLVVSLIVIYKEIKE